MLLNTSLRIGSRSLLTILAACRTVSPSGIKAENIRRFDPFAIPTGALMCRPVSADPGDSAAFEFNFIDGGDPTARITLAAFDSIGRPRFMMIHTLEITPLGERRAYMYAVQFNPKSLGSRVLVPDMPNRRDSVGGRADSSVVRPPKEEELTTGDIAHTGELVRWLWNARCKG